ncbi:hypothetical protein ONS95_004218 [Cadophora gregata]|uniref:uncharacterized protein n=1 Tax=Cadophora gregata TaxID=51156 RepID=UPI0026DD5F54|nr:uncharacterized protein ONS95_004218 [Cadophora gregata]KAK0105691.1 hypothetical protein ONS95_004218 [Cadophora gregata]
MADPFSIVGSAAAILQFSEFAGKVIYTACDLYSSVSGHTRTNEGTEKVTLTLQDLLCSLQTQHGSGHPAGQDVAFAELINRCRFLGNKLLLILKKIRTRKGHSLRESLKSGMMTVWKKSEMDDLRRELESCSNQLGLHLVAIFRSEAGQKLEELLAANSSQKLELALLRQALVKIELDQKLAVESLVFLREVFSPSDPVLKRMNQERILKSLAFQGMGRRYEEVSSSTTGTFNWILQDLKIPESHPDLKICFKEWLIKGTGVYHIAGKPGAGKSTLMKFIVEHENTRKYLQEWANGRALITASVFFWKPGTRLQKSLEGLIRSLVHAILRAVPDMMPTVFPQYWNPRGELFWDSHTSTDIEISLRKVLEAFETLVSDVAIMKDQCFCFFIDGLDEFEDPDNHHTNLVKRLLSWTSGNPANIKICVSSREENSFVNNLPLDQRLRLHLFTKSDMKMFVDNTLSQYDNFRANDPEDCARFVEAVATKAEGVFLWTKLVLRRLGDDLEISGSLKATHRTLRHIPEELERLFLELLTSIDQSDQKEAWTVLAAVMATTHDRKDPNLSLLDYYFVKDYLEDDKFAEALPILPLQKSEIISRQKHTALHLNRLLKGILEVDDKYKPPWQRWGDISLVQNYGMTINESSLFSFQGSVQLTHRSIYEFLKTDCPKETETYIANLDVYSLLLQCITAHAKSIKVDLFALNMITSFIIKPYLKWLQHPSLDKHIEQLAIFDDLLMRLQYHGDIAGGECQQHNCEIAGGECQQHDFEIVGGECQQRNYVNLWLSIDGINKRVTTFASVLAYSFTMGVSNYVAWLRKHREPFLTLDQNRAELCNHLFINIDIDCEASSKFVQSLVNDGIITRELLALQSDNGPLGWETPWQVFVTRLCFCLIEACRVSQDLWVIVLEAFLLIQVDTAIITIDVSKDPNPTADRLIVTVRNTLTLKESWSDYAFKDVHNSLKPIMSLREVIEWRNPSNCVDLLRLIDWNLALQDTKPLPGGWID